MQATQRVAATRELYTICRDSYFSARRFADICMRSGAKVAVTIAWMASPTSHSQVDELVEGDALLFRHTSRLIQRRLLQTQSHVTSSHVFVPASMLRLAVRPVSRKSRAASARWRVLKVARQSALTFTAVSRTISSDRVFQLRRPHLSDYNVTCNSSRSGFGPCLSRCPLPL